MLKEHNINTDNKMIPKEHYVVKQMLVCARIHISYVNLLMVKIRSTKLLKITQRINPPPI